MADRSTARQGPSRAVGVGSGRLAGTTRTMAQLIGGRDRGDRTRGPHGSAVLHHHDLTEFTVKADAPLAFQIDGDYLGMRDGIKFTSSPRALRVIC